MENDPSAEYHMETAPLNNKGFFRYEELFARNDMPRQDGMLNWRYTTNPEGGGSIIDFAVDSKTGDIGAVYAAMGTNLWHRGAIVPGLQSLDTLTDAAHRRRGLFPLLAKHVYLHAASSDFLAVYGFPNQNSCPTFERHLGWTIYGEVDFMFRPLRSGYFLRRFLMRVGLGAVGGAFDFPFPAPAPRRGKSTIRQVERFTEKHEAVWREVAQTVAIAVDRSAKYLNWRILERPDGSKYRVFEAIEDDDVVGFVIWCVEEKHGGRIGYLMECLVCPSRGDVLDVLLRHAIHQMSVVKADLVLAWAPSHLTARPALERAWFKALPPALRPTQLFWGALSFQPGTRFDAKDWYISYLDSDTV